MGSHIHGCTIKELKHNVKLFAKNQYQDQLLNQNSHSRVNPIHAIFQPVRKLVLITDITVLLFFFITVLVFILICTTAVIGIIVSFPIFVCTGGAVWEDKHLIRHCNGKS
ncbi:hypothetical protein C8J57DRAFT_1259105 [Mycena rebaudengoi]|nr:hypothetical protein C8J57DRAFT_1259105 [Mycena rebaudengoi]